MSTTISKSFILGTASALCIGALLVNASTTPSLQIPTRAADHNSFLTHLYLGAETDSYTKQELTLDTGNVTLVIPYRLIAGDSLSWSANKNIIDNNVQNAIIAGGQSNRILSNAHNSAIGAGRSNTIEAQHATIGAGRQNQININAHGAFIWGGQRNKVFTTHSSIAGGEDNTISAENSVIVGGSNNKISAPNSFAAGQRIDITKNGTFAWSDYNSDYAYDWEEFLQPLKPNTFLIRSLNGMAINADTSPTNVNVNIGGTVYLGSSQNKINSTCDSTLVGTIENNDGCYYYCDGLHRQRLNMGFKGDDAQSTKCTAPGNATKKFCEIGKTTFRPGDQVKGYRNATAPCEVDDFICGINGNRGGGGPLTIYPACLPGELVS